MWRTAGLTYKSSVWIKKAAEVFWSNTKGTISKDSLEQLRAFLFKKYDDYYARSKVLNFVKGFLKYQAKLTLDPRYLAFDVFLDKPRVRKVRKKMTARVVTKEDIEHVLAVIKAESSTRPGAWARSNSSRELLLNGEHRRRRCMSGTLCEPLRREPRKRQLGQDGLLR